MDSEAELTRRLARPSPLLLPWLARRVAADGLRVVASAAALHLELVPGSRWPVVADATAAVLARRWDTGDRELLHRLLRVLPPVAGHLAPEARRTLSWDAVPTAAAGYAAVAGDAEAARWAEADRSAGWATLLAGDPIRDPLPPLAHLGSLTVLREVQRGRPVAPSPAEAAYLLPHLDPAPPGWPELAVTAVVQVADPPGAVAQPGWYSRAVAARVLPLIDGAKVEAVASVLGVRAAARLRARDRAVAPEEELAVADGDIPRLTTLAAAVDADLLAELCLAAAFAVRDDEAVGDGYSTEEPVSYGYNLPPVPTAGTAPGGRRPVRHVNVLVAPAGGGVDSDGPLPADTDLEVLCSVGRLDPRGLTTGAAGATFPDEFLPDTALDLTAVLTVEGTVRLAELHVPARGDSATVRLTLAGRPRGTVIEAELGLYYQVTLVHLVALILPVEGASGVPAATVIHRLSTSLADLAPVADRSMSVSVSAPSGHARFLVNGTVFDPQALLSEPSRVDTAVRAVRTQLYEAHFRVVSGREVSRFDREHGKSVVELIADLRRLAHCGRKVYLEMFGAPSVARGLPDFLRTEGRIRGRPPVIQVIDPTTRAVPVPWAAVYDLPLGSDPAAYRPCPSIRDIGSGGWDGGPPVRCPYEQEHRQDDGRWQANQLCPWGFWGLSTLLEHPPHVVGRDLPAVVGTGAGLVILAADGPDLDDPGRRAHIAALRATLGEELDHLDRPGADTLGAALGGEVDVVYLFCHCGRDASVVGAPPDPYLHFDRKITPTDVNQWIETAWPGDHWLDRHPLVVINGCHTVETLSGSLSDFVVAFTSWAGGAGVIGTEVTVDQSIAAWAMELFLDAVRTRPVGEALRTTRWAMFGRGNVMGLAYTPYCLATLVLRDRIGAA